MIDWNKAPEWAQWAAMDSDGEWSWFYSEPHAEDDAWYSGGLYAVFDYSVQKFGHWRDSLHRRPDIKPQHSEPEQGGTVSDMVNHPPHYRQGGIECIEAIEAALTPEEFRGYCKGNALKYIWRERHKGGGESLGKAGWYLAKLAGDGNE